MITYKLKYFLFLIISTYCIHVKTQNTLSATYILGDIPTSLFTYDESCNGEIYTISVTLPAGDNYEVLHTDITYSMTAAAPGFMSDQRSRLYCLSSGISEPEVAGVGNSAGTMNYSRTSYMASDIYPGGSTITFAIYAKRIFDDEVGPCSSASNKIDNGTLSITVYYNNEIKNPKVGVNDTSPTQTLDINGKLNLGDDSTVPNAGTIRYNSSSQDFEGFDGSKWVSFTKNTNGPSAWGDQAVHENNAFSDPNGSYENYGSTVSIDISHAAIGKPYDTNFHYRQGTVNLKRKIAGIWHDNGVIGAPDRKENALFGSSVDIENNFLVVGSPEFDVGDSIRQGQAYIFEFIYPYWVHRQTIVAPDGAAYDLFGSKVEIKGDFIAISSPQKTVTGLFEAGKVYLYKKSGSTWNYLSAITAVDPETNAAFGYQINLNQNYLFVSAPSKSIVGGGMDAGKVYIYKRTIDNFSLEQAFTNHNTNQDSYFGHSFAYNGTDLFIGAPITSNGINNYYGEVLRYKKINNVWTYQSTISPSQRNNALRFGNTLSLHNHNLLISSNKNFGTKIDQGAVDLYSFENNNWCYKMQFSASDGEADDLFGWATSIFENEILIGALNKKIGDYPQAGAAYFFKKN